MINFFIFFGFPHRKKIKGGENFLVLPNLHRTTKEQKLLRLETPKTKSRTHFFYYFSSPQFACVSFTVFSSTEAYVIFKVNCL